MDQGRPPARQPLAPPRLPGLDVCPPPNHIYSQVWFGSRRWKGLTSTAAWESSEAGGPAAAQDPGAEQRGHRNECVLSVAGLRPSWGKDRPLGKSVLI